MKSFGVRGAIAHLLLTVVACCVTQRAHAQQAFWPKPGEDPRGTIHDTKGTPIAGATVRLVADHRLKRQFSRAIASVLASTPLPTVLSARDGSFALLLTNAQRQLESGYLVDFYLVVEKQGYLPWTEPVTSGLRWYLGSRVVLRLDRTGDPLRGMPWPIGVVAAPMKVTSSPWLPVPNEPKLPSANARGCTPEWPKPERAQGKAILYTLEVTDEKERPIVGALLQFDNECYRSETALPNTTDASGKATLQLVPGKYTVRCAADHHATKTSSFEVVAEHPSATVQLWAATVVDILAVTEADTPQPFAGLFVGHRDNEARVHPARSLMTDSQGRARVLLGDRQGYFCAQDDQKNREAECGAQGVVKVRKYSQSMVVLRADQLPAQGEMHWFPPDGRQHGRGFEHGDCATELVVTTLVKREYESFWIGNAKSPSIVVRQTDLPNIPADPLMDFCLLDRRMRLRANLTLKTTNGKSVRAFRLTPGYQTDLALGSSRGLHMFARRTADRSWQVWTRDDEAYQLTAWAKYHAAQPVSLPAVTDKPASLTITFAAR